MSEKIAWWFRLIFGIMVAGAIIYIIWDSWFKNKKKVNGKR
jgi:hypothetical protein